MARLLLAWEYGSGMGHLAILLPLAAALRHAGHDVTLALRDPVDAAALPGAQGLRLIRAPRQQPQPKPQAAAAHTLTDIFCNAGLLQPATLLALSREWQRILAQEQPQLVINEFSPTLALTTLGVIPVVTVGTGYSAPPAGGTLPNIRFWLDLQAPASGDNEAEASAALASTRQQLGLPALKNFSDLFGGSAQFVCTYPELDCYRQQRQQSAIGPLDPQLYAVTAVSASRRRRRPRAFAYLNAELANLDGIVAGIKQSGVACDAYIRGLSAARRSALSDERFTIHAVPQPLDAVLSQVALCIHHGGIATAERCLRHGVPQLVLANHLEQRVNGAALQQIDVAQLLPEAAAADPTAVAQLIRQMLESPEHAATAAALAADIRRRFATSPVQRVVETVQRLL